MNRAPEGPRVAEPRTVASRLVLGAFREQDVARDAVLARARAQHLAVVSRALAMTLDERETRETIRRLSLQRPGSWCIVDVVEADGRMTRLPVAHPDPSKQALASTLEHVWPFGASPSDTRTLPGVMLETSSEASVSPVVTVAHGEETLRILREIGFGALLVVPLIVRARLIGSMTFVSHRNEPSFTADETAEAVDLAGRCAMALDNARLYQESDVLRRVAQKANQSKTQFLANMSHELRTPLNAIGGFADLLEMGLHGPVTDDQRAALARIKANQQHLLVLITEILDFARVDGARVEYHLKPVVMRHALIDVASMLSGAAEEKGLTIAYRACDEDVVAWADPDRVRQILMNLVMNALKYAATPHGVITMSCTTAHDTVAACVADHGPGIAPAARESIFEPFVQLAPGLSERSGGVGLGLAISRDLARAMHGDLAVESALGVGSRFTLSLPIFSKRSTRSVTLRS